MRKLLDTVFKSLGVFVMLTLIVISAVMIKSCSTTFENMEKVERDGNQN